VVWSDNKTGNFEIYYRRSLDNGVKWDNEIRLTHTSENQSHPKIAAWENNVHVIWEKGYINSTDNGVTWGSYFNPFPQENISASPDLCVYQDKVYLVVANFTYHWTVHPASGDFWTYVLFKELSWSDWIVIEFYEYNTSVGDVFVIEVAMTLKSDSIHIIYGLTWRHHVRQIYHSYSLSSGLSGSWSNPELIVDGLEKLGISITFDQDLVRIAWSEWVGDGGNNISMGTNTMTWNGTWSDFVYVGGIYGMTAVSGYYITWSEADFHIVGSNVDGNIITSSGNPHFNWHDVHLENETVHLVYIDNWEIYYLRKITSPPPSPPRNLNIIMSGSDIELSWNSSYDDGDGNNNVMGYSVYRSDTGLNGSYEHAGWIEAKGSQLYTWVDHDSGSGDQNNYFYIVRANNTLNNEELNQVIVGKVVIPLGEGWNLFSIPLIQSDSSMDIVLKTIENNYTKIQGYHAGRSDPWTHWHEDKPNYFNEEISIEIEAGYYIDMKYTDVLVVAGVVPDSHQISLKSGWNLVGYPSFTNHNRTIGLNNLVFDSEVDAIQWFNSSTKTWHFLEEGDLFEVGRGYWIHAISDCVWEVPL
jgi:hypothetical protein